MCKQKCILHKFEEIKFIAAPADPCASKPCRNRETCVSASNSLGYICQPPPSKMVFFVNFGMIIQIG